MPKFSIVSITYKDLPGLLATEASIWSQSYEDFEWIVVDGGSGASIQSHLESITDARLTWISEQDDGIFDAMNKGLDRCSGDYVIFLNGGDTFATTDTLSAVSKAAADSPDFIYGNSISVFPDNTERVKPSRDHRAIWYGMFASHQAMFYKRSCIQSLRYRTEFRIAGDYCFTAEFLVSAKSVSKLDFPICRFDMSGVSNTNQNQGRTENWKIQRDFIKLPLPVRLANHLLYITSSFVRANFKKLYLFKMYR